MLKRLLLAALPTIFLLVVPEVFADDSAPPRMPAAIDLQDGDTLVFLGDSITHQRLYTQYVEDFFYQRFPNRRIRFHNAGIGGAKAWDALARVGRDVLAYKPRYVTILLGMNDGQYQPFNPEIYATYHQNMTALVEKIRAGGATPVLMSPTMFDARAARLRPNPRRQRSEEMLAQYNSVLAYYGRWLQDVAMESGTAYVDMFSLLNDLTAEAREDDPAFTLIRDAVHPDAPGQIVMAYAMIDDLGLRQPLSGIRIMPSRRKGVAGSATGGNLSNLKQTESGLEFDWAADGLPWVLPEEARQGVALLKLGHRATKESLTVHGLPSGQYELLIDDVVVGKFSDAALSRHIELQGNELTPQYQQALKVAMLNKKKNEGPVKRLRDGWRTFQAWARLDQAARASDLTGEAQTNAIEQAAAMRQKLNSLEQNIQACEAEAQEIEDEIYRINQPVTRHYVLRKIDQ